jgi:hypothetical protein
VSVALGGTASASDYNVIVTGGTLGGSTLTFAAGSSTATIRVTPVDDSLSETTESVTLTIGSGSGYITSGATTVSASIADNDAPPVPVVPALSIGDVTVLEGASPGYAVVTISLSSPAPSGGVTVQVRSSYGSADRKDFSTVNQSVTIAAGQSSTTVTVWISNDKSREGTETFTLTLSSPARATITDGTAVVTILDDESALLVGTSDLMKASSATATSSAGDSASATTGASATNAAAGQPLAPESVTEATAAAMAMWASLGYDTRDVAGTAVVMTDLPAEMVAYAGNGIVELDADAAGQGWTTERLVAAVFHEFGHLLGLDHAAIRAALRSLTDPRDRPGKER